MSGKLVSVRKMESKPLKTALEDTLTHLWPGDLMGFCFRLQRRTEVPTVALDRLMRGTTEHRKVNISKIVQLLVSTYTEAGAVSVAVEVLEEIKCHDEAVKLAMETGGRFSSPDPTGSPSSEEHFVDKYKVHLIQSVRDVEPILDELLTKGVIQQDSYDKISALPTSEEKIKELLDGHLKTVRDKDIFYSMIPVVRHQGPRLESERVELHSGPGRSVTGKIITTGLYSCPSESMIATGSDLLPWHDWIEFEHDWIELEHDWIKLEPEVNCVDADDALTYSLQSEAGAFECSVSGLRWVCKEKVSFKYQFGSWEEHMERLETMQYIPGGPLLNITVIAGKLDEAHLPHWICTEDNPAVLDKFAVLHIDTCGDVVEPVSEVTSSHVKLSQPVFSPRAVLMRAGFPVRINCKVLIYKTNMTFLTLHVYLIPCDPALEETIKNKDLYSRYKMIQKPYPAKSLKMRDYFILTADMDNAEINPEKLKLIYEGSDPNFFEVFIENPDIKFQLTLKHESGTVWTCAIRKDDYQNAVDVQVIYDKELARLRPKLVDRVSRELINQLLDDLLGNGVLNDGEKDLILQENSTNANRARCLIDMMKRKGREASRKLLICLQSRDPALCAELGLPPGLPV